jgi:hypothetical protein
MRRATLHRNCAVGRLASRMAPAAPDPRLGVPAPNEPVPSGGKAEKPAGGWREATPADYEQAKPAESEPARKKKKD